MQLPKSKIGKHEVSRLILGTNPFTGCSHYTSARDQWLRRYFTVERVVEIMEKCYDYGLNATFGPADEKLSQAIAKLRSKAKNIIFVSQPWGDPQKEKQAEQIRWLADHGSEICLVHCGYTDTHFDPQKGTVAGLPDLLNLIRGLGMVPGVSTHNPEVIKACDKAGYDTEVYTMPTNRGVYLCDFPGKAIEAIKNTDKVVIAIKPLAAGRIYPQEGLRFAFNTIKAKDVVSLGMMSLEEVEEDMGIVHEILGL